VTSTVSVSTGTASALDLHILNKTLSSAACYFYLGKTHCTPGCGVRHTVSSKKARLKKDNKKVYTVHFSNLSLILKNGRFFYRDRYTGGGGGGGNGGVGGQGFGF
jgi:hypothetical protein